MDAMQTKLIEAAKLLTSFGVKLVFQVGPHLGGEHCGQRAFARALGPY